MKSPGNKHLINLWNRSQLGSSRVFFRGRTSFANAATGWQTFSQSAASQPTSQSAPYHWDTISGPFVGSRLVLWSLSYGALRSRWSRWGFRAGSSHKPKQSNALFNAFAQSFCAKAVEFPIWSFLCAFKSRAPVFWSAPFFVFVVSNHGSYPLNGIDFTELSF